MFLSRFYSIILADYESKMIPASIEPAELWTIFHERVT